MDVLAVDPAQNEFAIRGLQRGHSRRALSLRKVFQARKNMSERPDQKKIHETAEDRERERLMVKTFADFFHYKTWRNTELSSHDAVFYDGETRLKAAAAEFKYRNNRRDAYPTYTIDSKKIDQLWKQCEKANIKAFLVVQWLDEIWYCQIKERPQFKLELQKRGDRDENADEVYHIPIENFIQVEAETETIPQLAEQAQPEREVTHDEHCAGCYEIEPGKFIHPPRNGGPIFS